MPAKSKSKPKTTKKKFTKKKGGSAFYKKTPQSVVKSLVQHSPFPSTYYCKARYCHTSILSVGTAGIYGPEQVFRLNSLYDPDFTGSGHQPYGRDQLALIYNKYCVYGALLEAEVTDPSEDGLVIAAMIQSSGSSFTITNKTVDEIKEKTNGFTVNINNTGSQKTMLRQYIDLSKVEGVSRIKIMNDDPYASAFAADPVLTPYLRIALANLRNVGSGTCIIRTMITYFIKCSDPITLSQS